ncbi:MAG: PQQ-binding-like beta-propeller repeat protein [Bdellovibrionales bacterium]|nr:PQQ-binding-like beta-propeller repeat protein [Bdellovibrionales bacterium]
MDSKDSSVDFFVFIFFIIISALLYILINLENPALFESSSLADQMGINKFSHSFEFNHFSQTPKKNEENTKNIFYRRYSPLNQHSVEVNHSSYKQLSPLGLMSYDNIGKITFFDDEGKNIWNYNSSSLISHFLGYFDDSALFVFNDHSIMGLKLTDGTPLFRKTISYAEEKPIVLMDQFVLYLKTGSDQLELTVLDLQDGQEKTIYSFSKQDSLDAIEVSGNFIFAYNAQQVYVFSKKDLTILVKIPLTSPIKSLASYDKKLIVASEDKALIELNLDNGNEIWRSESKHESAGPLAIDKQNDRIGLLATNGYLQVFELSTGKSKWRLNTFNESAYPSLQTVPVDSASFSSLENSKVHRNLILVACGTNKLCGVNPIDGLVVSRIKYEDSPISSPPIFVKNEIRFLSQENGLTKIIRLTYN